MNQSTEYQWKRHPDGGIAANIAVFNQLSCLVHLQPFSGRQGSHVNYSIEYDPSPRSSRFGRPVAPRI